MITEKNPEKAKQLIKKSNKNPIIVKAQDTKFNRSLLEYGKFQILVDIIPKSGKDKLKSLDSGLNHVLAKIAAKNKIAIGIDLKNLTSLNKEEKAITLARIKQNIKLCRKANCKIKLLNYKDKKSAQSLIQSLGASTKQAKDAVEK